MNIHRFPRHTSLAAALLFAVIVSTPASPRAHGVPGDDLAVRSASVAPRAELKGARDFVSTLARHGVSLLPPSAVPQLYQISQWFESLSSPGPVAASDPDRAQALAKGRTYAEGQLVALLESAVSTGVIDLMNPDATDPWNFRELSSDDSMLLLKLVHGDGPVVFEQAELDLERISQPAGPSPLPAPSSGTMWLLLRLKNPPAGDTQFHVAFQVGRREVFTSLAVRSPRRGQLAISIVDEDGKPVPSMVRLTNVATGRIRMPEGAVDLTLQTYDASDTSTLNFGRPFPLKIPPPFGGQYWLVPGPFSMSVSEGDWIIHVSRGQEHVSVTDTLPVAAGITTSRTLVVKRWIDMNRLGWWSGDDHVHARLMSDQDADRLLTWSTAMGINVSNILRMGNRMRTWFEQRGFGPDYRVQRGNYVLVPGQEDPRDLLGHCIAMNLKEPVRDGRRYLQNDWIADAVHAQGGLYGYAHVGFPFLFNIPMELSLIVPENKVDFGSTMQGSVLGTKLYFDFLDLGYNLVASSGSDTPYSSTLGESRVYVRLGDTPFSADAWYSGFRAGRTFVTNGPMLDLEVDGAHVGDEIICDTDKVVTLRARARGIPGTSAASILRIHRLSNVLVEKAGDQGSGTGDLSIETTTTVGTGFWAVAYARGFDGSEAHTSPIYVTRQGFRHWNLDKVEEIIARRRSDLNALKAIAQQAQAKLKAGGMWKHDSYNMGIAEEAPAILQRIQRANARYDHLLKTAETERATKTPSK